MAIGTPRISSSAAVTNGNAICAYPTGANRPIKDDLLLLLIPYSSTDMSQSPPAGWTDVSSTLSAGAMPAQRIYAKRATGIETGTVAFTAPVGPRITSHMVTISGVDTSQMFDAPSSRAESLTASSLAVPSVAVVTPGSMLVAEFIQQVALTTFTLPSAPAPWTSLAYIGGFTPSLQVAYCPAVPSGATGVITVPANKNTAGQANVLTLRPAPPPPPMPFTVGPPKVGAATDNSASSSSLVVAYPTGLVAGDLMFLIVGVNSSVATGTAPPGWNVLFEGNVSGAAPVLRIYYKFADGTETGSITHATPFVASGARIIAYPGVDTSQPFDAAYRQATFVVGTPSVMLPSSEIPSAGDTLLSVMVQSGTNGTLTAVTGGWTDVSYNSPNPKIVISHRQNVVAGPSGDMLWSTSSPSTGGGQVGLITLRRASPGGQPKVWNGSAWVTKPAKVWDGSAWVTKPVKKWTGSAWVPVS